MVNKPKIGYYKTQFIQSNPSNDLTITPVFMQEYSNNISFISAVSNRMPPCIIAPDYNLFHEEYTLVTYEDSTLKVKLGSIRYNCLYADSGSGNISASSIQDMTVLGADGIYSGVKLVKMDFTKSDIRSIEFNY